MVWAAERENYKKKEEKMLCCLNAASMSPETYKWQTHMKKTSFCCCCCFFGLFPFTISRIAAAAAAATMCITYIVE